MSRHYQDAKGIWRIEYTAEEKLRIERWRWRLRLKLARESMTRARERYAELRAAYYETLRREEQDVN